MLPVRPLLHDQVPVRAAARVEPRLPAPDAARQGDQVQAGRGAGSATSCSPAPTRIGKLAGIPVVVQVVNAVNRTPAARALMDKLLGVHPDAWLPDLRPRSASAGPAATRRPPAPVRDGAAHAGQGGDLLDLLRELQRARHRPRPARSARAQRDPVRASSRRRRAAACPSSSSATSRRSPSQGRQHPGARGARPRGLGDPHRRCRRCTLMFKQELPLMFPDDADVQAVKEAMFDPFEYLVAAPQGRPAEDRLQAARWARSATTSPATAGAERRPEDARDARVGAGDRGATPSSAAPATTAPTA